MTQLMETSDKLRLTDDFVRYYRDAEQEGMHPLLDSFNGLGYVVFKRTYARPVFEDGEQVGTEEWHETVRRVVDGAQKIGARYTLAEMERLYDHIWHLRGFPGGRMLWQLGTDNNERLGGDSLVNCWYVDLTSIDDFIWMFHRLMLGGGVGFGVSKGGALGIVMPGGGSVLEEGFDVDYIVPDNREGWGELLRMTMDAHYSGYTFTYSVDAVRPEGAPIKTFGGVASGPGELVGGLSKIEDVLRAAVGRALSSVEMLDVANIIGSIVVSGNVRRSAQIALGNPRDTKYLAAKRWDLGGIPNHRAMSNNSIIVGNFEDIPSVFWEGYKGNGEAYGLVNINASRRYGRTGEAKMDDSIAGFNPCAEIPLANRESCNLAELVLPNLRDEDEAADVALLLYQLQKAVANMQYMDAESDAITSSNMRLGLGVTGVAQATSEQRGWLSELYKLVEDYDQHYSKENGLPESVRLTTVKPSGTLSLLAGVTAGGHPGHSRYHIRRVRMRSNDPVFSWAQTAGYSWEFQRNFDGSQDAKTVVVEFPVRLPDDTILAEEMTAVDQLEAQAWLQENWADNAVSTTIYYQLDELPQIKSWLRNNWRKVKSVSFLLKDDHGFDQAPLETITHEEYHERMKGLSLRAGTDMAGTSELLDSDCVGGACPIR